MLKLIVFLKYGDILKMVVFFAILTKSLSSSLNELNLKKKKDKKIVFHPLEVLESSLILGYCRNLAGKCSWSSTELKIQVSGGLTERARLQAPG